MQKIKIQGMSCQHCVSSVTKALERLPGIKNIRIDLSKGEVFFENPQNIALNKIAQTITDAGYRMVEGKI